MECEFFKITTYIKMPNLTIITVAHKNPEGLALLKADIQPALGPNIEWIIKDSGVCEISSAWGNEIGDENIQFYSKLDSGIYSALNFALTKCTSDFYLVVGSDDSLHAKSLLIIDEMIQYGEFEGIDIASFPVLINKKIFHRKLMRPCFVSVGGLVSSHSVGTLIRRSLHESIGDYDEKYKILADAFFLRRAYENGAQFKHYKEPITGCFSTVGISNTQHARRILEAYSYNVACGDAPALQSLIMLLRTLIKKPLTFI
ncbi:putative glycosyl transferase [Burkholderiaceae bacterium]